MENQTRLPDKPSELILLALKDLEVCERLPKKYEIDMGEWFRQNSRCTVCFAGAVMAQTLECARESAYPSLFDENGNGMKLVALDKFRGGFVDYGLRYMQIPLPENLPETFHNYWELREELDYHNEKEEWWLHMQAIVGILQAEGL